MHFQRKEYDEAERRFRSIVEEHPRSTAAPEAVYWAGVSAYKRTQDPSHLTETGRRLQTLYPESEWARKGSVWAVSTQHH